MQKAGEVSAVASRSGLSPAIKRPRQNWRQSIAASTAGPFSLPCEADGMGLRASRRARSTPTKAGVPGLSVL